MAVKKEKPKYKLVAGLNINPNTHYIWSQPGHIIFLINRLGKGNQYGIDVYCACCGRLTAEKEDGNVVVEGCEHLMEFFDKDLDNLPEEERERLIERKVTAPASRRFDENREDADEDFEKAQEDSLEIPFVKKTAGRSAYRRSGSGNASSEPSDALQDNEGASQVASQDASRTSSNAKEVARNEVTEKRYLVFEEEIMDLFSELIRNYEESKKTKRSKSVSKRNLLNLELPSSVYSKTDRHFYRVFEINGTLHGTCDCPGFLTGGNRTSSMKYNQASCKHTNIGNLIVGSKLLGGGKNFINFLRELNKEAGRGVTLSDEVSVPFLLSLSSTSTMKTVMERLRFRMEDELVRKHGASAEVEPFEGFIKSLTPDLLKTVLKAVVKYRAEIGKLAQEKRVDFVRDEDLYVDLDVLNILYKIVSEKNEETLSKELGVTKDDIANLKNALNRVSGTNGVKTLRKNLSVLLWRVPSLNETGKGKMSHTIMQDIYSHLSKKLVPFENHEVLEMFQEAGRKYPIAEKQKVLARKYERGHEIATGKLPNVEGRATSVQFYEILRTFSEKTGMTIGDLLLSEVFALDRVRVEIEHIVPSLSYYYSNVHKPEIKKMLRHVITGTDGSIKPDAGGGMEFRSGWMYGPVDVVRKIREIYHGMMVAKSRSNFSCGFHLHVYMYDKRPEVAFLTAAIWASLERYFYCRMVSYYRIAESSYCITLWKGAKGFLTRLTRVFDEEEIDMEKLKKYHEEFVKEAKDLSRYSSINFGPYIRALNNGVSVTDSAYGTFEIRLPNVPFTSMETPNGSFDSFDDKSAGMAASLVLMMTILPVRLAEKVVANPSKNWPKLREILKNINQDMRRIVRNAFEGFDINEPLPYVSELLDMAGFGANSMPVGLKAELFSKKRSIGDEQRGYFVDICPNLEGVVTLRTQIGASNKKLRVNEKLVDPEHFSKISMSVNRALGKGQDGGKASSDKEPSINVGLFFGSLFDDEEENKEDDINFIL